MAIIKPTRILLIEKDETLASEATVALEKAGYKVDRAVDYPSGLKKLYEEYPDLIIVSNELPMANDEDPYLRIRQASYLPIIVLGSQKEEAAEMLELGADAYVTKPPSLNELVARVRVLLRRKPKSGPPGGNNRLPFKDYFDRGDNGNGSDGLTSTEFRLASCLVLNKGRLLDYSKLISEVWGGKEVSLDTLHFYVRRLRHKLLQHYTPCHIVNSRGVGYYLREGASPQ